MEFDILNVPFSYCGSFWAFSTYVETGETVLYLKNVRESCSRTNYQLFEMRILVEGEKIPYQCKATASSLTITSHYGDITIAFGDQDTFGIVSTSKKIAIEFILLYNGGYSYHYQKECHDTTYTIFNLPQNRIKMVTHTTRGMIQPSDPNSQIGFQIRGEIDGFCAIIQEVEIEWESKVEIFDLEETIVQRQQEFEQFMASMLPTPLGQEKSRWLASYILWSCHVKQSRFLSGNAIYMSKNDMCNIWSWDNCMNAIAISYGQKESCIEQLLIPLYYQDEHGMIPDLVNDVFCLHNFCKPPIYGWAIKKIQEQVEIEDTILKILYEKIAKNTLWWFTYRDSDNDGVCEYLHGNDSGWDNSTLFLGEPPVETPDLQTFLVLQMDFLIECCQKWGLCKEKEDWEERQKNCLNAMIQHCFVDEFSVAKQSGSHQITTEKSLICFIPLMLGERLPREIRIRLLNMLETGNYMTEYGLATEPLDSSHYQSDGYWRGPIWGISSLMVAEGLEKNGRVDLAKEIAKKFANLVSKSGMAENFDAITGEPLCDKAFTWTSSCYLYLSNRYLMEETVACKKVQ